MTMRPTAFRLGLAAIAAGIAGPALAQACLPAAERTAFDVRALQSQLMVVALQCGRDGEYNAFVRRFQGDLASSYRAIEGHFRRTSGGAARRETDGFITQLANAHSQDGIRQGSLFCGYTTPLFQAAMQQSNAQTLAELAVDRNVLSPMAAPACPATPARGGTASTRPPARR